MLSEKGNVQANLIRKGEDKLTGQEYDKAFQYIYRLILDGTVRPGDRLPTERLIAETLGISRNSTREALSIFLAMGMIERRQGSGNYVAGNFGPALQQMIYMMLAVNTTNQNDICTFRKYMEKAVCAALNEADKEENWYIRLEEILNRPVRTIEEEIERDRDFHYGLICETKNTFWITIMDAVVEVYREWIDRCLRKVSEAVRGELGQIHKDILEGLKKGDMQRCRAAIDRHYDIIDAAMEVER